MPKGWPLWSATPPPLPPLADARTPVVHRASERLRIAVRQVTALEAEIRVRALAARLEPLTRVCGINVLTAAALAGILGPGDRFPSDADLAAYAGAAPLEASSATALRHRLNRGGNRRLNAILYRIALTQARHPTEGRAYLSWIDAGPKARAPARPCPP